jgi:hypothetical protein
MTTQPVPASKPKRRRLPRWWGLRLPCGCVRGVKLCAEAERLWEAVAEAHHAYAQEHSVRIGRLRRVDYDEALAAFNAHFPDSGGVTGEQAELALA